MDKWTPAVKQPDCDRPSQSRALEAELLAAYAWQRMESAPRDGRAVALADADAYHVAVGYWADMTIPGWWLKGVGELVPFEPAHWTPLPPLPWTLANSFGEGERDGRG